MSLLAGVGVGNNCIQLLPTYYFIVHSQLQEK